MKHYFLIAKDVGDLTRIFCAVLEEQNKRRPKLSLSKLLFMRRNNIEGFRLDGNRLTVRGDDDFARDPVKMIRLFHTALANDLDIHPHALWLIRQKLRLIDKRLREDPEANRLFVEMLTSRADPEVALRHMNEAGVLGRFVPDFGRVVAQMQYDMYHVFTVDEHTIQAVGILHRIEAGDLAGDHPRPPRSSIRCSRAAPSISRCSCTTSPRGGAAITRSLGLRSPPGWGRVSG